MMGEVQTTEAWLVNFQWEAKTLSGWFVLYSSLQTRGKALSFLGH